MGWESSGEEGRKEERKKVEEVCIPVLIKKKSVETRNERKKGERGWADWAHGCRKELVWCVCVCVCAYVCVHVCVTAWRKWLWQLLFLWRQSSDT